MTTEITEMLEDNLLKSDVVLELGISDMVMLFAKKCKKVTAIESSPELIASVRTLLNEQNIRNVSLILKWDENTCVEAVWEYGEKNITVVSINTQIGINRSRILRTVLKRILPKLRMIVLNDYANEELYPEHYNKVLQLNGGNWQSFYNGGSRIYFKQ